MTSNIPASIFNVLVLAFFVVVALGVAIAAYAATQLKRQALTAAAEDASDAEPVPAAPVAADESA